MRIQNLDSDAVVLIGDAYDSNALALFRGDEALLIDSLGNAKDALDLKNVLEKDLGKSVRWILCSHYFSDHIAGLRLFPGSEIIAHKTYLHTFDSERFRSEEERSFYVEPNVLISAETLFRWGRFHLRIFPNQAHTMSTINVDIPELDLVHVADNIVGNIVYLAYTTPELFFPAIDDIRRAGRTRLISGHEGIRPATSLQNAQHYVQSLREKTLQSRDSGNEDGSLLQVDIDSCLPPGIKGTPFESIFHKRNLQSIVERKLFGLA